MPSSSSQPSAICELVARVGVIGTQTGAATRFPILLNTIAVSPERIKRRIYAAFTISEVPPAVSTQDYLCSLRFYFDGYELPNTLLQFWRFSTSGAALAIKQTQALQWSPFALLSPTAGQGQDSTFTLLDNFTFGGNAGELTFYERTIDCDEIRFFCDYIGGFPVIPISTLVVESVLSKSP